MDFRNKKITIMGLGLFGGGIAAARFLAERGAIVTVTDLASEEDLKQSLVALDDVSVHAFHLNGHVEEDFTKADVVLVNPAVSPENHFVQLAQQAGATLTSEMNLFWQLNRGKIVGVTGSNGKSTTAGLIHAIVSASQHQCYLGGNIGCSLLDAVEEINPDDIVVLELSSFQLENLSRIMGSPCVSVVTNFSPNHLDWHGSIEAYRKAKQTIFNWQSPAGIAICPSFNDEIEGWNTYGRVLCFGQDNSKEGAFLLNNNNSNQSGDILIRIDEKEEVIPLANWLTLRGVHNFQNALAAVSACIALGISIPSIEDGIKAFKPLPHRLQLVGEKDHVQFYNDSLATTPESAVAALHTFDEPIVLIAGGYDKQVDLNSFAYEMTQQCQFVLLIGETADIISMKLDQYNYLSYKICDTIEEAFTRAVKQSTEGDIVLLSPGCASYGMFLNFVERGETFTELVHELETHCHVCDLSSLFKTESPFP